MKTFKKRTLDVFITMTNGADSGAGSQTWKFSGVRASCRIRYESGAYSIAEIQIYGLKKEFMSSVVSVGVFGWTRNEFMRNRVTVKYPDELNTTIFDGYITSALVDYNNAPDVALQIMASGAFENQMTVVGGMSFPGVVAVGEIMRRIVARGQNLAFENRGVDKTLTDESVNGSVIDMVSQVAAHAGIDYWLVNNVLIISNKGGVWTEADAIKLDASNGLDGYPTLTSAGCNAAALFDPQFVPMRRVRMSCPELWRGERIFYITGITHELDSEVPGGRWHSRLALGINDSQGG